MRRIALLTVVLAVAGAIALTFNALAQGSDTYHFDVIFDDARGLVSGQQVKIAGAEAGAITNVVVTRDYKARVEAEISGPFQMHTNATCIIRPDGLIAENYLDCDPGSQSKPLLKPAGGYPPTVPVTQTSEPVELLDLFDIFNLPTRERFQALIDEFGITTAGNGDQINSILQRANPTLQAAQRLIVILDRQDTQIADEIDNTNQIALNGTNHIDEVKSFINQSAGLAKLTSDHSSSLEQAINRLPGFLAASTPAMRELNTVATDGTPLLASLRTAAPYLDRVDHDIVPFTRTAEPGLASLSTLLSNAIPDLTHLTPVVKTIGNYLTASRTTTSEFSHLTVNLIDHGFSENFLSVLYYVAASLSKYDGDSHLLSSLLLNPDNGMCGNYATTPVAACNAHYGQNSAYVPSRRAGSRVGASTTSSAHSPASSTPAPSGSTGATSSTGSTSSAGGGLSGLDNTLSNVGSTVSGGVSTVASGVGGTVNKVLGGAGASGSSTSGSSATSTSSLSNLLGYLLK